jgi:hypothetical protein
MTEVRFVGHACFTLSDGDATPNVAVLEPGQTHSR